MSLLEDARRDTSDALRAAMLARYLERERRRAGGFGHAAHVLAAQRNLKILGLFTRLCRRDGKPRYLRHLPRVWAHLRRDLAHPALAALARVRGAARAGAGGGGAGADRGGAVTPEAMMIFAAGLGTRMGELTRDRPKPLIEVGGRPLIDHALALAREAGVRRIVVNTHAHAGQMRAHSARGAGGADLARAGAAGDRRRAEARRCRCSGRARSSR